MSGTEKKLLIGFGFVGVLVLGVAISAAVLGLFIANQVFSSADDGAGITAAVTNAVESSGALGVVREVEELQDRSEPLRSGVPLQSPRLSGSGDLVEIYQQVTPGVVSIEVFQTVSNPFGGADAYSTSSGSGFVYADGLIVTNSHVVGTADEVEVVFYDGLRREGRVLADDQFSDLAVVAVDDMPRTARVLSLLEDFDELQVGQEVIAVGNPFGQENTMTYGIISALGRVIPSLTDFSIPQAIQTDAPINPGNSGGPLMDLSGRVIGVNVQISTLNTTGGGLPGNSGVGFAVPASLVARVAPHLAKGEDYPWAYLGVTGLSDLTLDVVEANDLGDTRGAYILSVVEGGPSYSLLQGAPNASTQAMSTDDQSGVMRLPIGQSVTPVGGDLVTAVDGQPVLSFDDLLTYVALETTPGQTIELTLLRDGEELTVPVELGERPVSGRAQPQQQLVP